MNQHAYSVSNDNDMAPTGELDQLRAELATLRAQLIAERDTALAQLEAMKAIGERLYRELKGGMARCDGLHHSKKDQHGSAETCPVEARIASALAEWESAQFSPVTINQKTTSK